MQATILGGGREVGRMGVFNEFEDKKLLIDYGIMPEEPPLYPLESPPVKNAIVTHSHLDHSGMVPWLCSRYGTRVFSTDITKEISDILFRDAVKIADSRGHPYPYGINEVEIASEKFRKMEIGEEREIDGLKVKFHSAGHIPGSIMVELVDYSILYALDINTVDSHLLRGASPVKCDTLFIEGTYAGVEHPPRPELERQFLDEMEDIINRGGKVIIPAFAVGRTQELAMVLNMGGYDFWLEGMGKKISEILLKHRHYLRSPEELKKSIDAANLVYSNQGKKLALKSGVVLTTSGMLNGGPVLWYIDKIKDDPKSAVIITGYQVEGTNGRMLLENGEINLYGVKTKVNCQVKFYDFSAHAGHSELIRFIKGCSPENVVIVHSENPEALAEDVDANIYMPSNGEKIKI